MQDIRLKSLPFEYNGKTYHLVCNYNVIADIQEEFGEIPNLLKNNIALKAYPVILSAMLNDYADSMGWSERFTPREVGRTLDFKHLPIEDIKNVVTLVIDSLYERVEKTEEDNESKN